MNSYRGHVFQKQTSVKGNTCVHTCNVAQENTDYTVIHHC